MSSRLLSDVVHGGLAGPCRRVGDGSRAEDGASAGAHLAPYGRDQGLRLVAAGHSPLASVRAVDEVDHVGETDRGGVDGEHVAAALATLAVHQPTLPQVVHDLLEELAGDGRVLADRARLAPQDVVELAHATMVAASRWAGGGAGSAAARPIRPVGAGLQAMTFGIRHDV